MSKVESHVDDAKKFAQRCKALEAQLRQTITKKEHHEIVLEFEDKITGMEKTISSQDRKIADQEKEIARDRAELQRSASLVRQIADVGAQVASLGKTAEAQGKTVDSLLFKVSQGTVPAVVHQQSLSKAKELEERIAGMVGRGEYNSLQRRYEEATRQLESMVPSSEYEALKGRVQDLEGAISSMAPREKLESSEATVRELRARLAEHVPQSTYDELVARVVQLAEEVTGGQPLTEEESAAEPEEPAEPEQPRPAVQPGIPAIPTPVREDAGAPPAAPPTTPVISDAEPPEIREVGTQLAELKTEAFAEKSEAAAPDKPIPAQKPSAEDAGNSELALVATDGSSETALGDQA